MKEEEGWVKRSDLNGEKWIEWEVALVRSRSLSEEELLEFKRVTWVGSTSLSKLVWLESGYVAWVRMGGLCAVRIDSNRDEYFKRTEGSDFIEVLIKETYFLGQNVNPQVWSKPVQYKAISTGYSVWIELTPLVHGKVPILIFSKIIIIQPKID